MVYIEHSECIYIAPSRLYKFVSCGKYVFVELNNVYTRFHICNAWPVFTYYMFSRYVKFSSHFMHAKHFHIFSESFLVYKGKFILCVGGMMCMHLKPYFRS